MRKRHVPQRSCIACGNKASKHELHRVVRTPRGECVVDENGKVPGRGAYLCQRQKCWESAVRTGRLAGALRGEITSEDTERLAAFGRGLTSAVGSIG